MLALTDKGFEAAIVTIVKDVKEHMFIMKEHERNLSREIEITKQDQMEIPELKNTVSQFKN